MANAARALSDLFEDWQHYADFQSSLNENRVTDSDRERAVQAMRLLARVTDELDGARHSGLDVEIYDECVPDWTKCIGDMLAGRGHPSQLAEGRRMLRALAGFLGNYSDREFTDEQRAGIAELATEILEAVQVDTSLPSSLRRHIEVIARNVRIAIDEFDTLGAFNLEVAVERLVASVGAAATHEYAGDQAPDSPRRWSLLFGRVLGFGRDVATGVAVDAASQLMLGA